MLIYLMDTEENATMMWVHLVLILKAWISVIFLKIVSFIFPYATTFGSSPACYGLFGAFLLLLPLCFGHGDCRDCGVSATYSFLLCLSIHTLKQFVNFNDFALTYYDEHVFSVTVSPVLYPHISVGYKTAQVYSQTINNRDHTAFPPKPVYFSVFLHTFMLWCFFFKSTVRKKWASLPWNHL